MKWGGGGGFASLDIHKFFREYGFWSRKDENV